MAALELAPIVAAYLRKNGFLKTLAAFSRENGETLEEEDVVDLETLLKLYTSTQLNGNRETKKSKKAKFKDTLDMANGNENTRDNAEEKVNGGAAPKIKKKKKGEKENLVDSLMVPKTETKNILKEEGLKKKKEENSKVNKNTEGLKLKGKNCLTVAGTLKPSVEEALYSGHAGHDSASNKIVVGTHIENGGGLTIEQEVAHPHPPESLNSRSKKTKKEQGGEQLAGSKAPTRLPDSTQVSSQENGLSKKKRKKSKDAGEEETTKAAIAAESACETPMNDQSKKLNVTKRPVELLGEPGGCGFSSKKKKQRKEFSLEGVGDINGNIQEPSGVKLEASKNEEDPFDSKKQSGMKRKHREDTSLVNGISNHDHNNSMASPEKTKGGGSNVIHQWNVEKHESDSTKENKHKETPNNKQTPTGALAFKRVEVEKVSFSDPRLRDNSYWAKDGAEQGYGAKAQEVLGLVRGRDFRHEKTKKKRGSYRGGLIGFQSHSIKFQNSDED